MYSEGTMGMERSRRVMRCRGASKVYPLRNWQGQRNDGGKMSLFASIRQQIHL